jgi:hypothetical protein
MPRTRTVRSVVAAAAAVLLTALSLPGAAEAHGHHAGYIRVGFGGFYGWGPYWGWGWPWGWGWGPGPYYYGAPGGALGYAMMSGMGALDLHVKPNRAGVWVDGKYVAEARDLDGDPSYLWLKEGSHHVVVYKAGFRSFEEDLDAHTGIVRELKVKLEPGESQPPARAASEVRPQPLRAESTAPRAEAAEPRSETAEPRGGVSLRVQPRDAAVYVDGEYRGTARQVQGLRLPAGHHRVELARPGFQQLVKEFDIEADRTIALDLRMERAGGWKY